MLMTMHQQLLTLFPFITRETSGILSKFTDFSTDGFCYLIDLRAQHLSAKIVVEQNIYACVVCVGILFSQEVYIEAVKS